MLLEVHKLPAEDVYRDFARVPEAHRKDSEGRPILEGTICRLSVEGRTALVSAQGLAGETRAFIRIDGKTRNILGIIDGKEYGFDLVRVGLVGQFRWAWSASDPATRIAARIGSLSLILGVVSLVLGLVGLYLGVLSLHN